MTTDHVALAIMNGTTPQHEAGQKTTEQKAKAKRTFVMPESVKETIAKMKDEIAKLLTGKVVEGFKIGAIATVETGKKSVWLYFALTGPDGKPVAKESIFEKSPLVTKLEAVLAPVEAKYKDSKPFPVLCFDKSYWTMKKSTAQWGVEQKAKAEGTVAATGTKADAKPAEKKSGKATTGKVPAAF